MLAEGPVRSVVRVVLLDGAQRVLLVRHCDAVPADPRRPEVLDYWVPPGGGLEPGESLVEAAGRELEEETGVSSAVFGPVLWIRRVRLRYGQRLRPFRESYLLARSPQVRLSRERLRGHERAAIRRVAWWTLDEIRDSSAVFFPEGLAELLEPVVAGRLPDTPTQLKQT